MKIKPRTKLEQRKLDEGKPPFATAIWFGEEFGWGVKYEKDDAAVFEAMKGALS